MSLLTQALMFGLAAASISALGRRRRMVMVFDVTHVLYHAPFRRARVFVLIYQSGITMRIAASRAGLYSGCA